MKSKQVVRSLSERSLVAGLLGAGDLEDKAETLVRRWETEGGEQDELGAQLPGSRLLFLLGHTCI